MKELIDKVENLARRVIRLETIEETRRYGTAFPASPFTRQRYFRTDQGIEYYYDGTRWLSTTLYEKVLESNDAPQPLTQATHQFRATVAGHATNGFYISGLSAGFFSSTAQSGTNFYTLTLDVIDTSNTTTNLPMTSGNDTKTFTTNSRWWEIAPVFTATAFTSGNFIIQATMTPTANPGTFRCPISVAYRLIG